MNIKGILFISFILLVFSLAAVSASDLGHVAISDSNSDGSILAHVPVTVSSHDDSVVIDDNSLDLAVDDSSIDDGQSVPDDGSSIDDGDKSIPDDGDDSSIDDGDNPIHVDPQEDIDGDINDGDSIIINITNDTPKNKYNDKPISNVKAVSGSFDDLQSLIDLTPEGTVLMLSRDYDGERGQQVLVNKNIVIDGQGHTINCHLQCRAIYSNAGDIFLKNLKIINGDCDNSSFYDKTNNGGAIWIGGTASYYIKNCTFTRNWADDYGGAIYNEGNNTLYIINCVFKDNQADDYHGGAIYSKAPIHISDSILSGNVAYENGGAIYCSCKVDASNCTFEHNKANGVMLFDACGGAIYTRGNTYIDNCTFDSNYADDYGGAIFCMKDLHINFYQVGGADYNTFFNGNIADDYRGGAICCGKYAHIKNAVFDSNKAWTEGGAIDFSFYAYLTHCLFDSNSCGGAVKQCKGGAIFAQSLLNTTNCIFKRNYAEDYGGAVYTQWIARITNSTFEGNKAGDYGGAIYSEEYVSINNDSISDTCSFIDNRALDDKGGAIYAYKKVYAFDADFYGNTALVDGGAIFSNLVDLEYSTFMYNRASGAFSKCYGGAIRTYTAKVISCIFRENYSENHGGAIFTNTFSEAVKNCTFYFNQAREDGGAVYINNENDVLFTQCTFIINRCLDQGGAIYADSSSARISLSNSLFKGNHAETEGHVVFNYGYFDKILNNWWGDNIPTEQNGLLVEHKYLSSNINHVDSDPLRLAISCPSALTVGKTARATLYFVKSDGSAFTGEIPLLMEFVLPSEYKLVSSGTTMNSIWIDFTPEKAGKFTISGDLFGEVVSVTSTVTGDSSSAGNSVDSGFANADSSIVKNTKVNTQFAKSLCDFSQSPDDFSVYSPWLLILSIFGL